MKAEIGKQIRIIGYAHWVFLFTCLLSGLVPTAFKLADLNHGVLLWWWNRVSTRSFSSWPTVSLCKSCPLVGSLLNYARRRYFYNGASRVYIAGTSQAYFLIRLRLVFDFRCMNGNGKPSCSPHAPLLFSWTLTPGGQFHRPLIRDSYSLPERRTVIVRRWTPKCKET